MEQQFFTWQGWDLQDNFVASFYDCVVVDAFGPYKVGDRLPFTVLDFEKGVLQVWDRKDADEPAWTGKLRLQVVN